jgi:aromatic ring-opening dioxygenase catalytic subunit (LigB family)
MSAAGVWSIGLALQRHVFAHLREDHLLPLMVAVGAAYNETGVCVYHEDDFFGGISVSSFRFGEY